MQKLHEELKDKGLEIIAVNVGDDEATIESYVRENHWTLPIVMDSSGVAQKFGVQGFPTNYILNAKGEIVWRATGADEDAIRQALKDLGVS